MIRGMRANLLLAVRISRRLLIFLDLRDKAVVTKAVATKAKAKVNHSKVRGNLVLLASRGR